MDMQLELCGMVCTLVSLLAWMVLNKEVW